MADSIIQGYIQDKLDLHVIPRTGTIYEVEQLQYDLDNPILIRCWTKYFETFIISEYHSVRYLLREMQKFVGMKAMYRADEDQIKAIIEYVLKREYFNCTGKCSENVTEQDIYNTIVSYKFKENEITISHNRRFLYERNYIRQKFIETLAMIYHAYCKRR